MTDPQHTPTPLAVRDALAPGRLSPAMAAGLRFAASGAVVYRRGGWWTAEDAAEVVGSRTPWGLPGDGYVTAGTVKALVRRGLLRWEGRAAPGYPGFTSRAVLAGPDPDAPPVDEPCTAEDIATARRMARDALAAEAPSRAPVANAALCALAGDDSTRRRVLFGAYLDEWQVACDEYAATVVWDPDYVAALRRALT